MADDSLRVALARYVDALREMGSRRSSRSDFARGMDAGESAVLPGLDKLLEEYPPTP